MERVVVERDKCKGCRLCVYACPLNLLFISSRPNNKGYYPAEISDNSQCTSCAACARMCPDAALSIYRPS